MLVFFVQKNGHCAIDFVRHFLNAGRSTNQAKISLKFTDKVTIFDDLSVSKTHFTDKPAFFSDLSVNFWPL